MHAAQNKLGYIVGARVKSHPVDKKLSLLSPPSSRLEPDYDGNQIHEYVQWESELMRFYKSEPESLAL